MELGSQTTSVWAQFNHFYLKEGQSQAYYYLFPLAPGDLTTTISRIKKTTKGILTTSHEEHHQKH